MSAPPTFGTPPRTVTLARSGPVAGRVRVPGSKSQTNRAFVLAALGAGESRVTGALVADDSHRMTQALATLGIPITRLDAAGETWQVTGCGGQLPDVGPVTLDAGYAGTVMRFLSSVVALAPHETVITGEAPLLKRPVGELLTALREVGADIRGAGDDGGFPPVTVGPRRPRGGAVVVDASRSSQFASALLMAAPLFDEGLDLRIAGLAAPGYFDMTAEMMRRRGVNLTQEDARFAVKPGAFTALDEEIAGDASAASHLLVLAAATGGRVVIEKLAGATLQPDMAILEEFAAFGCTVEHHTDGSIAVTGPERLEPVDADLSHTPDQLSNIAVLAALAPGSSVVRGVGITRFHETDRMAAVASELAKVGVDVESSDDAIVVHGGTATPGATLHSHHDHRLAMAFASLGAVLGDVRIDNADAVAKTYPAFWTDVAGLGVAVSSTG